MHNLFRFAFACALVVMMSLPFWPKQEQPAELEEAAIVLPDSKPDFAAITDVKQKKKTFFDYIRPAVQIENRRVAKERARLLAIQTDFNKGTVSDDDQKFCQTLSDKYDTELNNNQLSAKWFESMLLKVNIIPEALVLTQAANESAWGTSRFAVQANNYFGQWCYRKGCGLIPLQRIEGAAHEVAKFSSMSGSVHAYFMNVNRNRAYAQLRLIRAQLADKGEDLNTPQAATQLSNGLLKYSERGQEYVNDLQSMIRVNQQFWNAG